MKTARIPVMTKWWIALVIVLALVPCLVMAEATTTLNDQVMEAAKVGDLQRVKGLLEQFFNATATETFLRRQEAL